MYNARIIDGIEREAAQFFQRANANHPERGGARKDRFFVDKHMPRQVRQAWSDLTNAALERAGAGLRVDPRSCKERGLVYVPQTPAEQAKEQSLAVEHWQERKHQLGLGTRSQEGHTQFVQDVGLRSRQIAHGTYQPLAQLQAAERQLSQQIARLERYHGKLQAEALLEAAYTSLSQQRSPAGAMGSTWSPPIRPPVVAVCGSR
jgi:hypothetical protein